MDASKLQILENEFTSVGTPPREPWLGTPKPVHEENRS